LSDKGFTVRLNEEQAAELEAVARVDGVSVAEEIRQAITDRIAARRQDEDFQQRLQRLVEENQQILDKLAQR
jgi:cell division protein ZapA (FtsZ GTPase activity inhibitor)